MTAASQLARNEDERLLADSIGRFGATANEFETRRQRLAEPAPNRMALWADLAELGVQGASVPEAAGGLGGGPGALGVVMEALGAALVVEPVLAVAMSARLLEHATDGLALVAGLVAGTEVPVIAHQEGADPFAPPRLAARRGPDGWCLDGAKPAVRHGDVATIFLVSARGEDGAAMLFSVPRDAAGLTVAPLRLIDGAGAADLVFAAVPAEPLAPRDGAAVALADALDWGLSALAAETAGIIAQANRITFEYLAVRKQFGTTLASFQALRHRAADMAMAGEEAAAMAARAIAALDDPPSPARSRIVLSASLACDEAGRLVGHDAVQLHGGMGVSDELVVSHYARRLAAIRHQIGAPDIRRARLATLIGACM